MIITRLKPIDAILRYLEGRNRIFLFGCGSCAEQCETGGEKEVNKMVETLQGIGKEVVGASILDETCYSLLVKKEFKAKKEALSKAEVILVLACGAGVKAVADIAGDGRPVVPALDTLFLANVERYGRFFEGCSLCGDCLLGDTGGICPHTQCPKDLLNGPCGGMERGMCEVNLENECAWVRIHRRLKAQGRLHILKGIAPPKDHSNGLKPRKVILCRPSKRP